MTVVNHVGLCVADLDRSRRFYEEVFGFTFRNDLSVPDDPAGKLLRIAPPVGLTAVYLVRDGFVLELLGFARNEPSRDRPILEPGLTHISLSVADVDATCARVEEFGGEVLRDTDIAGLAIMIRDPDGQLLELLAATASGD